MKTEIITIVETQRFFVFLMKPTRFIGGDSRLQRWNFFQSTAIEDELNICKVKVLVIEKTA